MSAQDKIGIHQLTSTGKECIKHYGSLVRACTKCLHDRTSVAYERKLETIDIYSRACMRLYALVSRREKLAFCGNTLKG